MSFKDMALKLRQDLDDVYAAGKDVEWSDFWDQQQEFGKRADYSYAFNSAGWNNTNFKPKYDIVPTKSNTGMFSSIGYSGSLIALFKKQGIVLDTTSSTGFQNMFLSATKITEIPELVIYNSGKATSIAGAFGTCLKLQTVSIDIQSSVSSWVNTFATCPELINLTITGSIDVNGFSVQWSTKLSHDSLLSILNALADKTSDTSTEWKVTVGATNMAKLTSDELQIAYNKGWTVE